MVSHILVNIGLGNGMVLDRCQTITWINAALLKTRPTGNLNQSELCLSEIWIKIQIFPWKKMSLNMSST